MIKWDMILGAYKDKDAYVLEMGKYQFLHLPFSVFNNAHILAFKNGDAGIGGTKVDTDNLTHPNSPLRRITAALNGTTATPCSKRRPKCHRGWG